MKGMQKIKRGKNFSGAVFYALKPGSHHRSDPKVIGGNMLGDSALELISEFDTSKQFRPDVQKPVWHNSLRLPAGESLTTEQWVRFADDYMRRMGFNDTHLRCYVLHDDMAGQHIHIIASRIDLNGGKLYLGRNENLISTLIISELEIAHGLTVTKTAPAIALEQPQRKRLSRNEQKMQERLGSPVPKERVRSAVDNALSEADNVRKFVSLLAENGISALPNIASTGKMNGFSFEYTGIAFKASQLGKRYGWKNIQEKLCFNPVTDTAYLLSQKTEALLEEKVTEVDAFMQLAMNPVEMPATIHLEPNSQQRAPEPVEAISIGEAIEALSRKIQSFKAEQLDYRSGASHDRPKERKNTSVMSHYQQERFIFTFKPFRIIYAILLRLPTILTFKTFDVFQLKPTPRKPSKIRP
jgi:hypothetical protein